MPIAVCKNYLPLLKFFLKRPAVLKSRANLWGTTVTTRRWETWDYGVNRSTSAIEEYPLSLQLGATEPGRRFLPEVDELDSSERIFSDSVSTSHSHYCKHENKVDEAQLSINKMKNIEKDRTNYKTIVTKKLPSVMFALLQ